MGNKSIEAYKRAQARVKKIKGFYRHLTIYLIVNAIILIEGLWGINFLEMNTADIDPSFVQWLIWNVFSVPILWGIVLFLHGIRVFSPQIPILRQWEENQIRRYMEQEKNQKNNTLV